MRFSKLAVLLVAILALGVVFWFGCQKMSQNVTEPTTAQQDDDWSLSKAVSTDDLIAQEKARLIAANPGIENIIAVQERNTAALMGIEGVVAVGIVAHPSGSGHAIAIFTKVDGMEKYLPTSLEGVTCVVQNVGEISIQQCTSKFRPIPNGVSVGPQAGQCLAGTLGCIVERPTGAKAGLSNSHVIAGSGTLPLNTNVSQPSPLDNVPLCGIDPTDTIGRLKVRSIISCTGTNVIDAALCSVGEFAATCATPSGIGYGSPTSTPLSPFVGQSVQKVGRTTCHNTGSVTGINMTVAVSGYPCGTATFTGQIFTTLMSQPGDSGSLLVDSNRNPVGLLFASNGVNLTVHNPITAVLSTFNVTVCDAP